MDEHLEIKSLRKALRVLRFLNLNGDATVSEVALAIGVPRATSYRLLLNLASEGYVERHDHSNLYRLTSLVHELSSGFSEGDLFVEAAKSVMRESINKIRWPLALATPCGAEMIVRAVTDHDTPLAIDRYYVGFRVPLMHAPAGLCYLAYCPDEELQNVLTLAKDSKVLLGAWPFKESELHYMLEEIRRKGYCHIRFPQYREGGLAVPLFTGEGKVMAGIVMRYVKTAMKPAAFEEQCLPLIKTLSADITAAYSLRLQNLRAAPKTLRIA